MNLKLFQESEATAARDYAATGALCLYLGKNMGFLLCSDVNLLHAAAAHLGIRRATIDLRGQPAQHVDIEGPFLERALAIAKKAPEPEPPKQQELFA